MGRMNTTGDEVMLTNAKQVQNLRQAVEILAGQFKSIAERLDALEARKSANGHDKAPIKDNKAALIRPEPAYVLERNGDQANIIKRANKDHVRTIPLAGAGRVVGDLNQEYLDRAYDELYPQFAKTSSFPYWIKRKPGKAKEPYIVMDRNGQQVAEYATKIEVVIAAQGLNVEAQQG